MSSHPPSKILIAEDVDAHALAMTQALTATGYECLTAPDGGDALVKTFEWRPDVVIIDLLMAPINGWEYLDSKRLIQEIRDIPVVVVSGYTVLPQPLTPDVVAVLQKPVEPEEVVRAVQAVLNSGQDTQSDTQPATQSTTQSDTQPANQPDNLK